MPNDTTAFTIRKGHKDGCLSVSMKLSVRGYGYDSARIEGSTYLTIAQARALAVELTSLADQVEAKAAAKEQKEERRRIWLDREVAAGRIKRVSAAEFFNGR
jgi:hypothetical protein